MQAKSGFIFGTLQLLKQLLLAMAFLSFERVVFWLFNQDHFKDVSAIDFIVGMWIDWMTISLCFIPYVVIFCVPPSGWKKIKRYILIIYFSLVNILFAGLNLMDVEYFEYTNKRSTADLFTILGAGNDLNQLITTFLVDFWFLIVLFIAICTLIIYLFSKSIPLTEKTKITGVHRVFIALLFIGLMIISGRGGLQLKPAGVMEVTQLGKPEKSGLLLNTPFTMIKSFGKDQLEVKNYFSDSQAKTYFNPIQKSHPAHILPDSTNVVVIILESFGNEFVGYFNDKKISYSPFFDSLLAESLTFEMGIANGKKSIEAVPAILASIPNLMDNPYISSPYATNHLNALPSLLKKSGYSTAFYHGATNGSMRFDAFAKHCGFDQYFGRYEYNNDAHFDKTWGILDEYFNPWTARSITNLPEPFFATLFTLSSHHPYYVPSRWQKKLRNGPHPICKSINYGDMALHNFFKEAKKQPWYSNTIFVLVADHTPATNDPYYSEKQHMYSIPIAFYDPKGRIKKEIQPKFFQQLDILPTLLDLLNIETTFYAYGNSLFKPINREGITYLEGSIYYFYNHHLFTFTKEKARNLLELDAKKEKLDSSHPLNEQQKKRVENRIKAMVQRYNSDMIRNKLTVE